MQPKTHHSKKPDHSRLMPYDRQRAKQDLSAMVMDYFNNNHQEEHPLTFCLGLDICAYADLNCLYKLKGCYYE